MIGPDGPTSLEAGDPSTSNIRGSLLTLGTHANRDLKCWPAIALLAAETGLHERTVRECMTFAEQTGWIHREPRKEGGQAWRNYVYTLTLPVQGAGARPARHQEGAGHVSAAFVDDARQRAGSDAQGAVNSAEGAGHQDTKVRVHDPINNVQNSSYINTGNSSEAASPSASPAPSTPPALNCLPPEQPSKPNDKERLQSLDEQGALYGLHRAEGEESHKFAIRILKAKAIKQEQHT